MGQITYGWTFNGTEGRPFTYFTAPIQHWTGPYTVTFTLSAPPTGIYNFGWDLVRSSDNFICWSSPASMIPPNTGLLLNQTVNSPPFAWHGFDWDTFVFRVTDASSTPPAGMHITIVFEGAGITDADAGYCPYGTQPVEPGLSVVQITAQLVGQLIPEAGLWAYPLALLSVGLYVSIPALCSGPPPPDEDLHPEDFQPINLFVLAPEAQRKLGAKVRRSLWRKFCQCTPATPPNPPPVIYIDAHWEKPTWYYSDTTYNISNTDIAITLNRILQNQTTNLFTTNNTYNNTTSNTIITNETNTTVNEIKDCSCHGMYIHGAVHDGLVDEDEFPVSDLFGIEVEILERPGGLVLPGNPDYLWNMGWLTTKKDGYMVEERRLTRQFQVWLPKDADQAAAVGYQLNPGVMVRITELRLPPLP